MDPLLGENSFAIVAIAITSRGRDVMLGTVEDTELLYWIKLIIFLVS